MSKTTLLIFIKISETITIGEIQKKDIETISNQSIKQRLLNIFSCGTFNTDNEIENSFENYKKDHNEVTIEKFKNLLNDKEYFNEIKHTYNLVNTEGIDIPIFPEEKDAIMSIITILDQFKSETEEYGLYKKFHDQKEKEFQLKVLSVFVI